MQLKYVMMLKAQGSNRTVIDIRSAAVEELSVAVEALSAVVGALSAAVQTLSEAAAIGAPPNRSHLWLSHFQK